MSNTKTKDMKLPTLTELGDVDVKRLAESPSNPRKRFDETKLAELADSVRAVGMLQPLLVRKALLVPKHYEIVFGHRRFRAAKAAKLKAVPCRLAELTDREVLELQLAENVQRADMHPLDEADGFAALGKLGAPVDEIAAKVARPAAYVRSRLKLAGLYVDAREAFLDGRLGVGQAGLIAGLARVDDEIKALEFALDVTWRGKPTVKDLSDWIRDKVSLDLAKAPWELGDEDLELDAGACSICTRRTGSTADLFAGIEEDRCLDSVCWGAKQEAWKAREAAEGRELLKVDTSWGKTRKGTLPQSAFVEISTGELGKAIAEVKEALQEHDPGREVTDEEARTVVLKDEPGLARCEHVKKAEIVAGHNKSQIVEVCAEPTCKIHGGMIRAHNPADVDEGPRVDYAAEQKKDRAKRVKRAKKERFVRGRILEALLGRVDCRAGLPVEVLRLVVERLLGGHDVQNAVHKRRGWKSQKAATVAIAAMDRSELARLATEALLLTEVLVSEWAIQQPKALLAEAKRCGVDVTTVKRAAGKEWGRG